MLEQVQQHWIFAVFCLAIMLVVVRLIARERVTLQSSLTFLALLVGMLVMALFPNLTFWVANRLGFVIPSNFLFSAGIGALVVLNVATLMTLSRVELRSIAVTQELGLLQERLDRVEQGKGPPPSAQP